MITGDNGVTASAIARKIGIPGSEHIITGDMLEAMSDEELREAVKNVSIFSRVIPEHKNADRQSVQGKRRDRRHDRGWSQ
jgi:Ca2+-transporting ATPase